MRFSLKRFGWTIAATVVGLFGLGIKPAHALQSEQWQVHGFLSQGYLKSEGNNFYGNSLDGSSEFTEAGISARWRASSRLDLAGQLFSRDAGATDNGEIDVDYLFADYKFIEQLGSGLGIRIGRVRNRYGLFNETRDVIFTRPSVLMPQAIYFEGNGLREILFSSDGAEFYGHWDNDDSNSALSITMGKNKSLSDKVIRNLLAPLAGYIDKAEIQRPLFAQFSHSRDGGDLRFAASLFNADLYASSSTYPAFSELQLDAQGMVFSAQRNFLRWSFTGEYATTSVEFSSPGMPRSDTDFSAYYLQSQYRLTRTISIDGRYENSRSSGNSSDASKSEQFMLGMRWKPSPTWVVAADIYHIRGTNGIPLADNPGSLDDETNLFAIMLGWRF